jgi:hypothetical protein
VNYNLDVSELSAYSGSCCSFFLILFALVIDEVTRDYKVISLGVCSLQMMCVRVKYLGYHELLVMIQNFGYDQFPSVVNGWRITHTVPGNDPITLG